MNLGEMFVGSFLAHYASEYYDPVKAREYYLRTRELKGKQNTSELTVKNGKKVNRERTDLRKQAWSYTKDQIAEAKKAELKRIAEDRKAIVEKSRETAEVRREEISNKLTTLLETLTGRRAETAEAIEAYTENQLEQVEAHRIARAEAIRKAAERRIKAIPPVPEGVQGPARERLVAARAKKVAKINGDVSSEIGAVSNEAAAEREAISADATYMRKALSEETQDAKANERESASVDRERVTSELKATVETARANYEEGKARLIAEFEDKKQREFEAIKANV